MGLFDDVVDIFFGSESTNTMEKALRDAQNIPLPVLKEYYPDLYEVVSQMNPQLESAVTLGPSKMQGIATDPSLRNAQMSALDKLMQMGSGEMSMQDKANLANIQNEVNTNLRGQQGAIMQNMAARGLSGGGSELVARQMAAQDAANRQAQMAMDAKAQAESRALNALIQGGQLGGQMQAQDFSQAAQKAQAADLINKFNAQNKQDVMSRNVASQNQAGLYNTQQQNLNAANNTELRNQAKQYNLGLTQQQYENELRKKGLVQDAWHGLGQAEANKEQGNRQFVGDLFSVGAKAWEQK